MWDFSHVIKLIFKHALERSDIALGAKVKVENLIACTGHRRKNLWEDETFSLTQYYYNHVRLKLTRFTKPLGHFTHAKAALAIGNDPNKVQGP